MGIISLIGNILSIGWHASGHWKELAIVRLLIINLSIADFLMGIYLTIIASANIYFAGTFAVNIEVWLRSAICLLSSFLVAVSALMSTFIMFLITLDRYLLLVYPFESYRLSFCHTMMTSSIFWIITITFTSIPVLYGINQPSDNRLHSNNAVCLPANIKNPYLLSWLLAYSGITFLIWIIISIMYAAIIVTLVQSKRDCNRQMSTTDKIILSKMIAIVATDLICWLPFYFVVVLGLANSELDTHILPFVAVLSLPLNSCINPILYTIFTKTFLNFARRIVGSIRSICNVLHTTSRADLFKNRSYDQYSCKCD